MSSSIFSRAILYDFLDCWLMRNAKTFRENCGDKLDAFLSRTYYINGGYDNKHGMSMLNARMEQFEVTLEKSPEYKKVLFVSNCI